MGALVSLQISRRVRKPSSITSIPSVLDRRPQAWTYILDKVFGEDWEARRAFVERWLHR